MHNRNNLLIESNTSNREIEEAPEQELRNAIYLQGKGTAVSYAQDPTSSRMLLTRLATQIRDRLRFG